MKKPPIGVMPEYIWKTKRVKELFRAIREYEADGLIPLPEWKEELCRLEQETDYFYNYKKEAPTMQVTYNGFTGELVKLERFDITYPAPSTKKHVYDLSIYDSEKQVTHSFSCVKLEDVKFMGGAVSFGG